MRAAACSLQLALQLRLRIIRCGFHDTDRVFFHVPSSAAAFKETIAKNPVVVVDWFATWCGPCKLIAPQIAK